MRIPDLFEETYLALSGNKVRSFLTMLGIIIGIGSVIAMIAIGQGAQSSIQSSIQSAGANLVVVMPGAQRGAGVTVSAGRGTAQTLTRADADAIAAQVANIQAVAPDVTRRYQVTAPGTNTNTSVIGTTPDYLQVRNFAVDTGTFITDQAVQSTSRVAVLGPTTRDDLFGSSSDPIGQSIRINSIDFKVIGIMVAKGGTGFSSPDDAVYVPISTAQQYLSGTTYVTTISVAAASQEAMSTVEQDITTLLLTRHNIADAALADFSVVSQADIIATASTVTNTFTLLLASIAGISLLVGGIGIMNMMLTTVTERTREIGLRKAIGAHKKDITAQFLMEAIVLTFLGGVFGIVLGWLLSFILTTFAGITSTISLFSVILSFGVSALIGIVFGYYPAWKAAQLNPIEALRYE